MVIDVSELFSNKKMRKKIQLDLEKDKFFYDNEFIQFSKPVKLDLILKPSGDEVDLIGSMETELLLTCSRCLEVFPHSINIQLNEKMSKTLKSEDEDIIFINDDRLDLDEIVENNIISMLPIKRICNKDCKGLCQQCGINLNQSTCKCAIDDVDPRLAKLKEVFLTD
ncbi:YceD family protein [Clostridium sp.]